MKKMNFHYFCDLFKIILESFYKSLKFLTWQFTVDYTEKNCALLWKPKGFKEA